MRSSTKYVGLDVHQATTIATVRESSGKVIARRILPTEEAALLELFAGMRGAVHVGGAGHVTFRRRLRMVRGKGSRREVSFVSFARPESAEALA